MRAECFYGEIEASVFEQVSHHSPCSCFKLPLLTIRRLLLSAVPQRSFARLEAFWARWREKIARLEHNVRDYVRDAEARRLAVLSNPRKPGEEEEVGELAATAGTGLDTTSTGGERRYTPNHHGHGHGHGHGYGHARDDDDEDEAPEPAGTARPASAATPGSAAPVPAMERPPEPELLENVGLQAGVVDRVPVDVLEGFAVGVARELQVTRDFVVCLSSPRPHADIFPTFHTSSFTPTCYPQTRPTTHHAGAQARLRRGRAALRPRLRRPQDPADRRRRALGPRRPGPPVHVVQ